MHANWDNIRQAVYVLGVGVLGAAAAVGIIEHGVQEQLTEALTQILGAVALVVAAGNVHKGKGETVAPAGDEVLSAELVRSRAQLDSGYVGKHRLT